MAHGEPPRLDLHSFQSSQSFMRVYMTESDRMIKMYMYPSTISNSSSETTMWIIVKFPMESPGLVGIKYTCSSNGLGHMTIYGKNL